MLSVSSIFHKRKMINSVSKEQLEENLLIHYILPQKARMESCG